VLRRRRGGGGASGYSVPASRMVSYAYELFSQSAATGDVWFVSKAGCFARKTTAGWERLAQAGLVLTDYTVGDAIAQFQAVDITYTGAYQQLLLYPDEYILECWGAGESSGAGTGLGAYAKGRLVVTGSPLTLYAYVGQSSSLATNVYDAGWNGGGAGYYASSNPAGSGGGGCGASDLRLVCGTSASQWNALSSLVSRILVAGGGGGGSSGGNGGLTGAQGASNGTYNIGGMGGTQTAGGAHGAAYTGTVGADGAFATGGAAGGAAYGGSSGGGGGHFGGAGGSGGPTGAYGYSGAYGGGGSSYASGHASCVGVTETGASSGVSAHSSGIVLLDTVIAAGVRAGHGRIRVCRSAEWEAAA